MLLLYPHPLSDVFRFKVLNVVETCVSLYDVDIRIIVQCIGKREEAVRIEEIVAIKVIDEMRDLAFFGACIYSGRGHDNFDYRKQSRRTISITLAVR